MAENLVYIEETLASSDVVTALTNSPYLLYSEVLEGTRRPLAFLQVVMEIKDLIGAQGNAYQFLTATQLSATKATEAQMISGMSAADKTLGAVDVSVTDIIYSAVELSDFIKEDFPNINMMQVHMRNMGKAVMEYLDSYIYTTISAGATSNTASCTDLDYGEVVDALTEAKDDDWIPDAQNPPFLIISSGAAAGLVQDTQFLASERYTTADVANMVQGEVGKFASCRVLETSLLAGVGYAFIVFPSDTAVGPVVALVWKREMRIVNEYEASKGYTYFNTSVRATPVVVQAEGIVKITITGSP